MKHLVPALLLLTGTALVVPAAADEQCLRQNMVNGWKVVDDQTLIVNDRVGHQFTVSLAKGCHDLKWPMRLAFSADTGGFGLSCIQRHGFVYVPANGGNIRQRCLIENVRPYASGRHADAAMDKR